LYVFLINKFQQNFFMFTHHSVLFDLEAESLQQLLQTGVVIEKKYFFIEYSTQRVEAKRRLRNSWDPHILYGMYRRHPFESAVTLCRLVKPFLQLVDRTIM